MENTEQESDLKTKRKKKKTAKAEIKSCTKVTEFGFCVCPHCEGLDLYGVDDLPKVGENKCALCDKHYRVSELVAGYVKEQCESLRQLLDKIEKYNGLTIEEIDKGIEAELTIGEVSKLCRYCRCSIGNLSKIISRRDY